MVVKELIEQLSKLDPDLLVAFSFDGQRAEVCDPLQGVRPETQLLHWTTNNDGGESLQFEDVDERGDDPFSVAVIY